MCMIDQDVESVTMLSHRAQTARKVHRCEECQRKIETGEQYLVESFVFDDRVSTHKTCRHCQVARDWLLAECGGWCFGAVEEDLREHALEGYPMDVKRLTVAMSRDWRNHSNELMALPNRPLTTRERQSVSL